jgi:hypothetical protein
MKWFLIEAAIAFFVLLAVMALVFRSRWASDMLRLTRNLLWVYVALIVVLAVVRAWRDGF